MLGFKWIATHAGAPDAPAYASHADTLRTRGGDALQSIPKTGPGPYAPGQELQAYVNAWVAKRGKGRAVVLVHGYDFDPTVSKPDNPFDDPYSRVFAIPGQVAGIPPYPLESWLPIVGETDDDGNPLADIAVPFAWTSGASLGHYGSACWNNSYQYAVFDLAPLAARALVMIIKALKAAGLEVDILAHSLGTRTTLKALGMLGAERLGEAVRRAVLMGGAEFSLDARDAMKGVSTDIYSFANTDDFVLTWGGKKGCHPFRKVQTLESRVIGCDGMSVTADWMDFQLNTKAGSPFRTWFASRGYPNLSTDKIGGRGNHWAYYMQPDNRRLFRDILAVPEMSVTWFRANRMPEGVAIDSPFGYGSLNDVVPPVPQKGIERIEMCRDTPTT